jgi:hypothetical protein
VKFRGQSLRNRVPETFQLSPYPGPTMYGYLRMLRRIVEQPDLGAGSNLVSRLLQSQEGTSGAIFLSSALTMARSRKHRVLFAFYWVPEWQSSTR